MFSLLPRPPLISKHQISCILVGIPLSSRLEHCMKTEPQKDEFPRSVENSHSSNAVVSHGVQKVPSQWSALHNRNYALLFWGYLVSSAGTQMQIVAVAWQVYL